MQNPKFKIQNPIYKIQVFFSLLLCYDNKIFYDYDSIFYLNKRLENLAT